MCIRDSVKSVEAHRDVVPIHFEGRNSNFFYNLANFCKMLGIKFNIAMLYPVSYTHLREIAEKLNLPLGTVKSRIFFTRQKLQQDLKDFR